jgi:hypothetical protein
MTIGKAEDMGVLFYGAASENRGGVRGMYGAGRVGVQCGPEAMMSRRMFKVVALALGGLVVLGASAYAADGMESTSVVANAICALIHAIVH